MPKDDNFLQLQMSIIIMNHKKSSAREARKGEKDGTEDCKSLSDERPDR